MTTDHHQSQEEEQEDEQHSFRCTTTPPPPSHDNVDDDDRSPSSSSSSSSSSSEEEEEATTEGVSDSSVGGDRRRRRRLVDKFWIYADPWIYLLFFLLTTRRGDGGVEWWCRSSTVVGALCNTRVMLIVLDEIRDFLAFLPFRIFYNDNKNDKKKNRGGKEKERAGNLIEEVNYQLRTTSFPFPLPYAWRNAMAIGVPLLFYCSKYGESSRPEYLHLWIWILPILFAYNEALHVAVHVAALMNNKPDDAAGHHRTNNKYNKNDAPNFLQEDNGDDEPWRWQAARGITNVLVWNYLPNLIPSETPITKPPIMLFFGTAHVLRNLRRLYVKSYLDQVVLDYGTIVDGNEGDGDDMAVLRQLLADVLAPIISEMISDTVLVFAVSNMLYLNCDMDVDGWKSCTAWIAGTLLSVWLFVTASAASDVTVILMRYKKRKKRKARKRQHHRTNDEVPNRG